MSEHDKADEARKGLIDSVKGKAKEIAGAVTGNDSLTAEGQLDQTQAKQRKEANAAEAVADAEAEQARAEATEARREAAQQEAAVRAQTAGVEQSVRTQQAAEKRAAEQAGHAAAAVEQTRAEVEAQREVERAKAEERREAAAAGNEMVDAAYDHEEALDDATADEIEAERLRREANRLSDDTDQRS